MDMHLVVVRPFGGLARGDVVIDNARIAELLNSEHAHDVVRVASSVKEG